MTQTDRTDWRDDTRSTLSDLALNFHFFLSPATSSKPDIRRFVGERRLGDGDKVILTIARTDTYVSLKVSTRDHLYEFKADDPDTWWNEVRFKGIQQSPLWKNALPRNDALGVLRSTLTQILQGADHGHS